MVPLQKPRREIGGTTYEVQLWPTSKALEWQERLAFLGLEPAAMFLAERQIPWTTVDNDDTVVLARTLLERLRAEDIRLPLILRSLLEGAVFEVKATPQGETLLEVTKSYETRFAGRTKDVYALALFVLEANLADFIDAVRSSAVVRRVSLLLASRGASADGETMDPSSTPPSPPTSTDPESAG